VTTEPGPHDPQLDPDAAQAAIEYCYEQGWSDGLPLVPATEPVVEAFLATVARDPGEVIGHLKQIDRAVTVRTLAINAVMAGCKPDYFPVVLAAWQALAAERATNGGGWQSTSGPAPLIVVNGPIRKELGLNSSGGVFGPGFRPNMTIPRAVGLTVRNGYGLHPHELEQATQGLPGRWSICFGENEEESPWPPLAEDLGEHSVSGNAVTATLLRTSEYVDNRHTSSAEQLLGDFADTIGRSGAWIFTHAQVGIVFCPEHAQLLASAGYDRAAVRSFLAERSGRTTAQLAAAGKDVHDRVRGPGGTLPPDAFQRTLPGDEPQHLPIAVAGARNAGISMVVRLFADWSGRPQPVDDQPIPEEK